MSLAMPLYSQKEVNMRKLTYFAVFEPSQDGGYSVYYPDLLGCTSYGRTFDEALKMAGEALGLHIYAMETDNDEIPLPCAPPDLDILPETSSGYIVAPVTIFPDVVKNVQENKAVKTNITLPAWLKNRAEDAGVNFSQVLQTALKEYLEIDV